MAVQHYTGSCQCGAVAFEVDVDISAPIACNCSRCRRLGTILAFAPASDFTLLRGEGATTEYLFNKHAIHHLFCTTCGIESYAFAKAPDGTDTVAINVNCLDGIDPRALDFKVYDGASA